MITKAASKPHYTEAEAAAELGLEVEELRRLIQLHIVTDAEDSANVPMTMFQASDLVLLRLLAQKNRLAAVL